MIEKIADNRKQHVLVSVERLGEMFSYCLGKVEKNIFSWSWGQRQMSQLSMEM